MTNPAPAPGAYDIRLTPTGQTRGPAATCYAVAGRVIRPEGSISYRVAEVWVCDNGLVNVWVVRQTRKGADYANGAGHTVYLTEIERTDVALGMALREAVLAADAVQIEADLTAAEPAEPARPERGAAYAPGCTPTDYRVHPAPAGFEWRPLGQVMVGDVDQFGREVTEIVRNKKGSRVRIACAASETTGATLPVDRMAWLQVEARHLYRLRVEHENPVVAILRDVSGLVPSEIDDRLHIGVPAVRRALRDAERHNLVHDECGTWFANTVDPERSPVSGPFEGAGPARL